jgi:hypothetical protein
VVYVRPPDGVELPFDGAVWRMKKALYGLKQAGAEWNNTFDDTLTHMGWSRCKTDTCLYVKRGDVSGKQLLLPVFVDDGFPACPTADLPQLLADMDVLKKKFGIKKVADASVMLGMRVTRDRSKRLLRLDLDVMTRSLLQHTQMQDAKPTHTPACERDSGSGGSSDDKERQKAAAASSETGGARARDSSAGDGALLRQYRSVVGALLYIMLCVRPDIGWAVGKCASAVSAPQLADVVMLKRVLRYLRGTAGRGIVFGGKADSDTHTLTLSVYVDADHAGCIDTRRSTSGMVLKLNGSAIAWHSRRQQCVSLSTMEAETYAANMGGCEVMETRQLLAEIGFEQAAPTVLLSDNQAALDHLTNPAHRSRAKHIDVKEMWLREKAARRELKLRWIPGEQQQADMLTKPLSVIVFTRLRDAVMDKWPSDAGKKKQQE